MYDIGNERILFLDGNIADKKKTTALFSYGQLSEKSVCMEFTDEWDREATYFNIVAEDGFYRMYYVALNRLDGQGNLVDLGAKAYVAALESTDGIHWNKPDYGVVEYRGSKHNNLINAEAFDNFFVYKDVNENCPPEKKYKALHMGFDGEASTSLRWSYSADGINFKEGGVIARDGTFDSLNTLHYDKKLGRYVCYYRNFHNSDGTDFKGFKDVLNAENRAVRDIRVIFSDDFEKWTAPRRITYDDGFDYQLYTNNIQRYYRSQRYYLGFPERYTEKKKWDRNFENLCCKEKRLNRMKLHPRLGLAITDHMFIHSTDGVNFTRMKEAFFYPGAENGVSWIYGDSKFCYGMIETANEIDSTGEISMYVPMGTWGNVPEKLVRYTIRQDGFAFYHSDAATRKFVSEEFIFSGKRLFFNMSTSSTGFVQVKIKDGEGNSIVSGKIFGDSSEKEIWFAKGSPENFAGKPVVMEIKLKESKVYSFRFI